MEKLRKDDPERIGPYDIVARLGSGGMGVVFLGTKGADRVAIKVVRSSYLDDPSLKTRFVREIETLQKIDSPYVAKFLDSSMEGSIAWHAVEFVNGPTLRELIDSNGPMNTSEWDTFSGQIRQALESVHRLGVVHRDLKPSNIIMSETGPKLIDFGISQDTEATSITNTGLVAGSPAWLAPEQLTGETISTATDLFSAGSVLVFAATGHSPWGQETTLTVPVIFQKILSTTVDFSGLTASQRELVELLLREDPQERRFDSTRIGISTATEAPVQQQSVRQPKKATVRARSKLLKLVFAAAALIVSGWILWWVSQSTSQQTAPNEEPSEVQPVDQSEAPQTTSPNYSECRTGLPLVERVELDRLTGTTRQSLEFDLSEFDPIVGNGVGIYETMPNQPKWALYKLKQFKKSLLDIPGKSDWSADEFEKLLLDNKGDNYIEIFRSECAKSSLEGTSGPQASSEMEFIETGEGFSFALELRSGDSERWEGDDRLPWVDARLAITGAEPQLSKVSISFSDSSGNELLTRGEFYDGGCLDNSPSMDLNLTTTNSVFDFTNKCSVQQQLADSFEITIRIKAGGTVFTQAYPVANFLQP